MQFFKPVNKVKAMTFDLDDTLYDNEPVIRQAEAALAAHLAEHHPHAATLSPRNWYDLKCAAIKLDPRLGSDMGQLRKVILTAALSGKNSSTLCVEIANDDSHNSQLKQEVEACFNCFYDARSNLTLAPDVHHILQHLSTRMPLIGITNGNVDADKIGITPYFDTILHASLTRPMKPAVGMFNEAAALLELPASHILHVGDNLVKDVLGAVNANFQAAWFACNRPMDLHNEPVSVLPHVALSSLSDLAYFCE
ncbi:haloacid dehalogenase [Alteromonas sp. MB-3u-76]|uniref:HAD-IA family hydrolase n=1 Tax=Alteromonas sp. MB-3u-76 TaxID=2058133 RepID=UPI000C30C401|nr:HAD-IA family hydrolase [Alteromonas sp. MB-3u-76]AUC86940.1 haloacid dehalogenase [Alteromonas sp. MB-3u-76]